MNLPPGAEEEPLGLVFARLFATLRTVKMHGPEHPLTLRQAASLGDAVDLAGPPFTLQFVEHAVFRDRTLVVLSPQNFARGQWLAAVLETAGWNELTVERRPDATTLVAFARLLDQGKRDDPGAAGSLPGLRMRHLEVSLGAAAGEVDPALRAAVQLSLAQARADALASDRGAPWPWEVGVAAVRALERAALSPQAALAVLESAPGRRHGARRAVSAAGRALTSLRAVEGSPAVQRAAAHALLALGTQGFEDRGSASVEDAARALLPRLLAGLNLLQGRTDPHKGRVCALVYALSEAHGRGSPLSVVAGLVATLYDLERGRCAPGTDFDLSWPDLLAEALRRSPGRADGRWVRVLIHAHGALPPGARVRCPDGREGVVLGPSAGGERYRVLVQGALTETTAALLLEGDCHGAA